MPQDGFYLQPNNRSFSKRNNNSFSKDVYQNAEKYGRFVADVGVITGIVFTLICVVVAIILFVIGNFYTGTAMATITETDCDGDGCLLTIEYRVKSVTYTRYVWSFGWYSSNVGDEFKIRYNIENPSQFSMYWSRNIVAWMILILGVLIASSTVYTWWSVRHYRFAAVLSGASALYR
jgi:hypothetical protein